MPYTAIVGNAICPASHKRELILLPGRHCIIIVARVVILRSDAFFHLLFCYFVVVGTVGGYTGIFALSAAAFFFGLIHKYSVLAIIYG